MSLLVATLFICVGGVWGQEAISSRDWIAIYWDFDLVEPLETPRPQLSEIQNSLIETLSSTGITPYYGGEPNYDIGIGLFGEERIIISIDPRILDDRMPQSTLLFAHPLFPLMHFTGIYEILLTIQGENTPAVDAAHNFLMGMSLYSIDRCDLADNFFEEAQNNASELISGWEIEPETRRDASAIIAFYRGNCALMQDKYTDAQNYFEQSVVGESGDINFSPTVNLAWTYLQLERPDDAFSLLDGLVDSQSNNEMRIVALQFRSQLYALAFRFDEAIADMDAAIELDPANPLLYVERGQRIALLYEWDRALADYNSAIELDPDYTDAYYYRGLLYASAPEGVEARAEAIADFQRYLDLAAPLGTHIEDAQRYIMQIQAQLEALGITPETAP